MTTTLRAKLWLILNKHKNVKNMQYLLFFSILFLHNTMHNLTHSAFPGNWFFPVWHEKKISFSLKWKYLFTCVLSTLSHNLQHLRTISSFELKRQNHPAFKKCNTCCFFFLLTRLNLHVEHHSFTSKLQIFNRTSLYNFLLNVIIDHPGDFFSLTKMLSFSIKFKL